MWINITIVILVFLNSSQFTIQQVKKCDRYEFQCAVTKKCIPIEQRCDGDFIDCNIHEPVKIIDLSDELDCHKCESDEFHCIVDQICIPNYKKCNGFADCQDASDEKNCPNLFLREKNDHDVQYSTISTRSLGEPSEKENIKLQTDDKIWTEKYDEFYTTIPQISQTKKIGQISEIDINFESTMDENQQDELKESLDGNTCGNQNNELRMFFGNMYEAATKLTKKRQRRLKKIIFDFILEMEEEQDNDKKTLQNFSMDFPLVSSTSRNQPSFPTTDSFFEVENGTYFPASGGYLMSPENFRVGKNFVLSLDIKPQKKNAILAIVHSGKDFFVLQMINGSVKLTVDSGNGPFYTIFEPQNANYLWNNDWHSIKAVKANLLAILIVDGQGTQFGSDPKGAQFTDTDHPLYIGGYPPELSNVTGIETNVQFVGCMKNLEINGISHELMFFNAFGLVLQECPIV